MRIAKPDASATGSPCPYCLRLVILDNVNCIVHHQAPVCSRWMAKLAEFKLKPRVTLIDEADIPKGRH
jgi:hypothetical protein